MAAKRRLYGISSAMVAAVLAVLLAGCSLPGGISFSVPNLNISLPENLDIPKLSLGDQTSVAEAKAKLMNEAASKASNTITTKTEGTLVVGVLRTSASSLVIEDENGQVSGLDADVAAALGYQLGERVRLEVVDDASSALASDCDVVMGVAGSSDGLSTIGEYAESCSAFFHRGDEGVVSASDLSGASVAVQSASVSERALTETGLQMQINGCASLSEAFELLESGSVDYVLCDAYLGAYASKDYSDISFAGALTTPIAVGVGVSSDAVELQTGIADAITSLQTGGVMDLIRERWVGALPVLDASQQIADVPAATSDEDEQNASDGADTGSDESSGAGSNAVTSVG